jgi:hypothetical protein
LISGLAIFMLAVLPVQAQLQEISEVKPEAQQAGGIFSYAVKFVCGFNRSNLGITSDGQFQTGEATVKIGNYATEVNIFNPNPNGAAVSKKVIFLTKENEPIGREPQFQGPSGFDGIDLPFCTATMDDCNRILEIGNCPPNPGMIPALTIGFLIIESPTELDVTAVYTAEICSDFVVNGPQGMCLTPPGMPGAAAYGAGISIDVEQIKGTYVIQ